LIEKDRRIMQLVSLWRGAMMFVAMAAAVGCSAEDPALGMLSLNLVSQAPSGAIYRLRDATITVSGPESTTVWRTEDDLTRTSLSGDVVTGNYAAQVQPGWRLERLEGSSTIAVTAELVSDNPALFTVVPHLRTSVPLRFRVSGEVLDLTQGYDVVLVIDEPPPPVLVVTNSARVIDDPTIELFNARVQGNVSSLRTIGGSVTLLQAPRGVAVANGEIFVCDHDTAAIEVFSVAGAGSASPVRRIAGPATGLTAPSGIAVSDGEIFVTQSAGTIVVFPQGADGNVAPSRTIASVTGDTPYIAVDHGEIFATDLGNGRILVYPVAGGAVPTRIIGGSDTGLVNPSGIAVHDGLIFVGDTGTNQIRVFAQTASGAVPPLRVLGGPSCGLSFPTQIAAFRGELYVASAFDAAVRVFPIHASGNMAPDRSLAGPSTHLNFSFGLTVF
jgi:hypothetical protein